MTPISLLISFAGLSHREASDFFNVRIDTVKSWSAGRNPTPDEVLTELRELLDLIDNAADQALNLIKQMDALDVELGYCVDDHEAQSLGLPCVGAHNAMLARVMAGLADDVEVNLVPRGSTLGNAMAIDRRVS